MSKEQILWATAAKVKTETALKHLEDAKANLVTLGLQGTGKTKLDEAIEKTRIALAQVEITLKNVKA